MAASMAAATRILPAVALVGRREEALSALDSRALAAAAPGYGHIEAVVLSGGGTLMAPWLRLSAVRRATAM
eukprot:1190663-Pleurochrysis_carterae.AAC.2